MENARANMYSTSTELFISLVWRFCFKLHETAPQVASHCGTEVNGEHQQEVSMCHVCGLLMWCYCISDVEVEGSDNYAGKFPVLETWKYQHSEQNSVHVINMCR